MRDRRHRLPGRPWMVDRRDLRTEKHPNSPAWGHRLGQRTYRSMSGIDGGLPWMPSWWRQRHARRCHRRMVTRYSRRAWWQYEQGKRYL